QALDLARYEGAVDQRAQPGMDRRLQFQHGIGFDGVETRKMRPVLPDPAAIGYPGGVLPSETAVAQQAVHVLVGTEAPVAVILPEEGRPCLVEVAIGLVRVLHEGGLVRVEPEPEVGRVEGKIGRGRCRHAGSLARLGRALPDRTWRRVRTRPRSEERRVGKEWRSRGTPAQ